MGPFSGTRSYSQNSGSDFKTSLDYRARTCLRGKKQQKTIPPPKKYLPSQPTANPAVLMPSIQRVVSSKTLTICRYFKELGRTNLKAENLSLVMGSTQTDTLMMKSSKQMRNSIMMKQGLVSNSMKNRVTAQTLSFSGEKHLPLHFSCISSTAIKVQSLQEISKVTLSS